MLRVSIACALCAPMAALADDSLGAWRDYAVRGLTPDFSWAEKPAADAVTPTLLDSARGTRSVFGSLAPSLIEGFSIELSRATFGESPSVSTEGFAAQRNTRFGVGLERTFLTPSFTQSLDESTTVTGSVVLAQQQFATLGFGYSEAMELEATSVVPATFLNEKSVGTGVRVLVSENFSDTLGFTAGYQSKIDMQAFQNYRGVFADPGDFDVPAIASAGFTWSPLADHRLGLNVQRVMYSDTAAFTSAALPRRFLSLLGDSDTSKFAWDDLTVYALDWTWFATARDAVQLRYSTQMQPEPDNARLRAALEPSLDDHNFALSYLRDLKRFGTVSFAASYAPSPYFLGNWARAGANYEGDQIEVEAVWTVVF